MSDSGNPPQDPHAQPDPYRQPSPYGQSAPSPYGQPGQPAAPHAPPYAGQPYAGAPYGAPAPTYDYAHWIKRVGGYLIDALISALSAIPAYALLFIGLSVGSQDMDTYTDANGVSRTTGDWNDAGTPLVIVGALLFLLPVAVFVWNTCMRQGRTGYSIGKGVLGIRLIDEATAQPIGAGMSFVRYLCHILDSLACYLGWLWPLWDAKRQTFADKIMKTVVVNQPKA
jgi:uncharacterized RDD family membrane protein YckC